jgi:hypothetical protein
MLWDGKALADGGSVCWLRMSGVQRMNVIRD